MRIDRRTFLTIAAGVAAIPSCAPATPLRKAAKFLWSRQAEDGGFHSVTYGLLRSGQSLTPFVLNVLLNIPSPTLPLPNDGVTRAFSFIRKHTNANGELGRMDETSADYPNYATALAVMAFVKAQPQGWEASVEPMVAQLRKQQFSEANGWKQSDTPFGAWGMGGPLHHPPETGHVDLSMTRCVLEALRAAGVPASDPLIERALVYVLRSQNPDGGFYFSIPNPEINKAGENAGRFRSYGTATADGLLALRACGLLDNDSRVALAIQWLKNNHQADRAPGFDHLPRELWSGGLRFYYAAAAARAVPGLPITLPKQEPDGSFRNSNPMVKEDDPLIATTFAAEVLTHSLRN